VQELGE